MSFNPLGDLATKRDARPHPLRRSLAAAKAKPASNKQQLRTVIDASGIRRHKQRLFIAEYLVDHNATRAAKAAGYSETSASQIGHMLLHDPQYRAVQEVIEARIEARLLELGLAEGRIIEELRRIALSNITEIADWGTIASGEAPIQARHWAKLKDSSETPQAATAAIKRIKVRPHSVSIELHDKVEALTKLGQLLGLRFGERQEAMHRPAQVEAIDMTVFEQLDPDERAALRKILEAHRNSKPGAGSLRSVPDPRH